MAALMLGGATATAQTADARGSADSDTQVTEIIVTARRTSEALQTTPVAVTAINTTALKNAGVASVADLQRAAPSVSTLAGGPGGAGTMYLSIRGQASLEGSANSDPVVATYVNGVNYARPIAGNLSFLDIAQVEVLRGPQGTLFGRNTTAAR